MKLKGHPKPVHGLDDPRSAPAPLWEVRMCQRLGKICYRCGRMINTKEVEHSHLIEAGFKVSHRECEKAYSSNEA